MRNIVASVNLFYRSGSSDKVYQVVLEEAPDGFLVFGANARRGATLKLRPKTEAPVSLDAARSIYDKLVSKKLKEGRASRSTPCR